MLHDWEASFRLSSEFVSQLLAKNVPRDRENKLISKYQTDGCKPVACVSSLTTILGNAALAAPVSGIQRIPVSLGLPVSRS